MKLRLPGPNVGWIVLLLATALSGGFISIALKHRAARRHPDAVSVSHPVPPRPILFSSGSPVASRAPFDWMWTGKPVQLDERLIQLSPEDDDDPRLGSRIPEIECYVDEDGNVVRLEYAGRRPSIVEDASRVHHMMAHPDDDTAPVANLECKPVRVTGRASLRPDAEVLLKSYRELLFASGPTSIWPVETEVAGKKSMALMKRLVDEYAAGSSYGLATCTILYTFEYLSAPWSPGPQADSLSVGVVAYYQLGSDPDPEGYLRWLDNLPQIPHQERGTSALGRAIDLEAKLFELSKQRHLEVYQGQWSNLQKIAALTLQLRDGYTAFVELNKLEWQESGRGAADGQMKKVQTRLEGRLRFEEAEAWRLTH